MPQNAVLKVAPRTWLMVTDADVTRLRLQSFSPYAMLVQATVGAVSPAADEQPRAGALQVPGGQIITPDRTLADLWPGKPGVNRVWVFSEIETEVSVSHE